MTQPTEYEQVTYNSPDGAQMENSTSGKIGFYGTAPIARQTLVAASTYLVTSNTTSTVGFTTLVDAQALVAQVSTITQVLKNLGLTA